MAVVKKEKIEPKVSALRHEGSHTRQAARRVGINVPKPQPSLTETEQEITDSY